jgi:uncharacterized protein (TIGR04255 family)
LIQVQQDRFVFNWRKSDGSVEYPRYEKVREAFLREIEVFERFLGREGLGRISPNQCEITYVNIIESENAWKHHGELGAVLTAINEEPQSSVLPKREEIRAAWRYVMRNQQGMPIGRLHVVAEPVFRRSDDLPMLHLRLTARGEPVDRNMDGVTRFLDLGREWIVRGFASITTPAMHEIWGRRS